MTHVKCTAGEELCILVVRLFCYGVGDYDDDCSISGLMMVTTWSEHRNETSDQALKILKDLKTEVIRDEWSLRAQTGNFSESLLYLILSEGCTRKNLKEFITISSGGGAVHQNRGHEGQFRF